MAYIADSVIEPKYSSFAKLLSLFTYDTSREKFWLALYARHDLVKIVNLKTFITFEIMIRSSPNFGKMLFTVCTIR